MISKIRFAILGPGTIAHRFAEDLKLVPKAQLVAVGSRDLNRAKHFAQKFNIPHAFGSYQALAQFQDIDIVYIATPHNRHYTDMALCLDNGKHILCEKPFTINAKQARQILQIARQKNLFVMEGMWTRFQPIIFKLQELLNQGSIGHLIMLQANLGFNFPFKPNHRLFNPHLGGGALLDLGVYPISLCQYLFGVPDELKTLAWMGHTNVDEINSVIFKYQDGRLATLASSLRNPMPSEATFMGTEGLLKLHAPLYRPAGISLQKSDQKEQFFKTELKGYGFIYEIEEVINCLQSGKLESDIMPHEDTLAVMELLDSIRSQWPLRYPME